MKLRILAGAVSALIPALLVQPAAAQDPAAPPPVSDPAPPPPSEPPPSPPASDPPPSEPPALEASGSASASTSAGFSSSASSVDAYTPPGSTDHDAVAGTFAVGYLGFREMLLPAGGDTGDGIADGVVQAPVIGARYWFNSFLGLDLGLGIGITSGSTTVETGAMTTETENPGPTVFVLHAGLPLALAASQHFVFEVVPEVNLGLAGNTIETGMMPVIEDVHRGTHFDVGARAGAEIHFGFIDIPKLALQAGVGLRLALDNTSTEIQGGPADGNVAKASRTTFGTITGLNPWNIFLANIAALYYF